MRPLVLISAQPVPVSQEGDLVAVARAEGGHRTVSVVERETRLAALSWKKPVYRRRFSRPQDAH